MQTDHPVYEFPFRLSPWLLVPGALLAFFLARSLIHSFLLFLARHMVNGVMGLLEFLVSRKP
ncbi:hypothetical protein ACFL3S_05365 [Gemmatimonadota bacterium]